MSARSPKSSRPQRPSAKRADAAAAGPKPPPKPDAAKGGATPTWEERVRELVDELVFVFVIVMFMKMFLVEIYKIPTGSMTPTLLGGTVAETDLNKDGLEDLVYWDPQGGGLIMDHGLLFINDGRRKLRDPLAALSAGENARLVQAGKAHNVYDKILVNKLVYWFKEPKRGEVVVFKVPNPPFLPETPIYIKRLVGEPGDTLSFVDDPATGGELAQLALDGRPVEAPDFFKDWRYRPTVNTIFNNWIDLPFVKYEQVSPRIRRLKEIRVPEDMVFMLGDNTDSSLDSRYWGGVPTENLKGRAFFRVWPPYRFGRIR
jgi:signal peptidase I